MTVLKNPNSFSVKQQEEVAGGPPAVYRIQVAPTAVKRKREDEDYDAA
jgi:hypothetical protein